MSVIEYESFIDKIDEPFQTERHDKARQMFTEEKTEFYPNHPEFDGLPVAKRYWVDHAAAQEFIDFVLLNAPNYRINLVSTSILDL
jgi:hypothetical protein